MIHILEKDAEGWIIQCFHFEDDEPLPEGEQYSVVATPPSWSAPSPTSKLRMVGESPEWVETASIDNLRATAILEVDRAADATRLRVVGDAARIKEHEDARLAAEQYRAADYTGEVPKPVADWAAAKWRDEWTALQAADDILAAAARDSTAIRAIRALRLDAKEAVRAAATGQAMAETVATLRVSLAAVVLALPSSQ
jgi:hypothetical protein